MSRGWAEPDRGLRSVKVSHKPGPVHLSKPHTYMSNTRKIRALCSVNGQVTTTRRSTRRVSRGQPTSSTGSTRRLHRLDPRVRPPKKSSISDFPALVSGCQGSKFHKQVLVQRCMHVLDPTQYDPAHTCGTNSRCWDGCATAPVNPLLETRQSDGFRPDSPAELLLCHV